MKTYRERIRDMREDNDLKQHNIAAMLKISQQKYSNYETGETKMPIDILIALADYYGVSTDYLLGRTNIKVNAGEFATAIESLSEEGCAAVMDYIRFQQSKNKG